MLDVSLVCVVDLLQWWFVNSVGNLRLMLWFVLLFSDIVCGCVYWFLVFGVCFVGFGFIVLGMLQ